MSERSLGEGAELLTLAEYISPEFTQQAMQSKARPVALLKSHRMSQVAGVRMCAANSGH